MCVRDYAKCFTYFQLILTKNLGGENYITAPTLQMRKLVLKRLSNMLKIIPLASGRVGRQIQAVCLQHINKRNDQG